MQDLKSMFKVLWNTKEVAPDINYTALPFELDPCKVLPVMLGLYAINQVAFKGQKDLQSVELAIGLGLIYSIAAGAGLLESRVYRLTKGQNELLAAVT
jgi:hypothetical protein